MKTLLIGVVLATTTLIACNSGNNKSVETDKSTADTTQSTTSAASHSSETPNGKSSSGISGILGNYIALKNALASDNGDDAAAACKALNETLTKVDTASFTSDQRKVYHDLEDDMKENAEHIAGNASKIDHQREHFEMLSKDMYDLVKKFGAGQTVYQDYCPMYNNQKGATWISETKDIKNPYLGKKMPTCGSVKEEIK